MAGLDSNSFHEESFYKLRPYSHADHIKNKSDHGEDEVELYKCFKTYLAVVDLLSETVLCHPFLVLRRQCQVQENSLNYHLLPKSLIPITYNLYSQHGLFSFWKGLKATVLVRCLILLAEDLTTKLTSYPKRLTFISIRKLRQNVVLKSAGLLVATPFQTVSVIETVQSHFVAEPFNFFVFLKEGTLRIFGYHKNVTSIWCLFFVNVALGVSRHHLFLAFKISMKRILYLNYHYESKKRRINNRRLDQAEIDMKATIFATILTDIFFYPYETILLRLQLKGSRTIIDNLDDGKTVLPILSKHSGFMDCYRSCVEKEGNLGLYKGFGALIMQYAFHMIIIYISCTLFRKFSSRMFASKVPPKKIKKEPSL